jgi:hypothetical protein
MASSKASEWLDTTQIGAKTILYEATVELARLGSEQILHCRQARGALSLRRIHYEIALDSFLGD